MFLNKLNKVSIILIASIFMHNIANAEKNIDTSPYYIRLDAGLSQPNGKLDNNDIYYNQRLLRGELYGAGVGYTFNTNVRTDLILTGRSNYKFSYSGTSDGVTINANQKINSTTLMLNTYYNAPINNIFSPYLNVGLGVSRIAVGDYSATHSEPGITYSYASSSNNKYNLAWNIGLGSQVKLTNNLACDAFFRFIDLGKTKTQDFSISRNGKKVDSERVSPFLLQGYETGISLIYRF